MSRVAIDGGRRIDSISNAVDSSHDHRRETQVRTPRGIGTSELDSFGFGIVSVTQRNSYSRTPIALHRQHHDDNRRAEGSAETHEVKAEREEDGQEDFLVHIGGEREGSAREMKALENVFLESLRFKSMRGED